MYVYAHHGEIPQTNRVLFFYLRTVNNARALRVAEIINDYRTLLVHISEQNVPIPRDQFWEEGYVVMRQCLNDVQDLMASNYSPSLPESGREDEELEKTQLQRVILDSSSRRFQAHKIYLRIAVAKRWIISRSIILRSGRPSSSQLRTVDQTLREVSYRCCACDRCTVLTFPFYVQELAQITDSYTMLDLRSADIRAEYWRDDDPSLYSILEWIKAAS